MADNNTTDKQFAFGENSIDGCKCPAVAAGYNLETENRNIREVVAIYDKQVKMTLKKLQNKGTVDANTAKDVWDDVILECRNLNHLSEANTMRHDIAVEVAEELGWR